MNGKTKKNKEPKTIDKNQTTELLDSSLIKGLFSSFSVYIISYSIFSLVFGNAFGAFIATPLSAISFFIISRWDRLRESKKVSFKNIINLLGLLTFDKKIILLTVFFISTIQVIGGIIAGSLDSSNFSPSGYTDTLEHILDSWFLLIILLIASYSSYLIGGYFSARLAIYKKLPPYRHSIISSLLFAFLSFAFTLMALINTEEMSALGDEETSVGAKVLIFSQFILLPLIGARIAVGKSKADKLEDTKKKKENKKDKEDFANLVASEIERLKPKSNDIKKKFHTSFKRKRK